MTSLKLVFGNKNYSSWSFRPWIAMRHIGLEFEEHIIPLFSDGYKEEILEYSPAGQVPVLVCDDTSIWGSGAILEFLAERYPEKHLWPEDKMIRARARSVVGEMQSGFVAFRGAMPMNMRRTPQAIEYADDVAVDIGRITSIWSRCRNEFGAAGPFLFGAFSNADAMYAPVVNRLHVYDVDVSKECRAYMDAMMALPAWRDWARMAEKETWVIDRVEL